MVKHTPGPWTIQDLPHQHDFRKGVEYVIRDARNCALAQVGHIDAIHDGQESEANARLIAAAPALLEALEAAVSTLETCDAPETANEGDFQFWLERQHHAIVHARAVIRAAKGVSNGA